MAAPKISLSLGASKKPPPKSNGVKRTHAVALRDQDHEDDDQHGKAQTVSHFDRSAGGAIDERRIVEKKAPLVIAASKNRDWKEASQRNKRMRYAQVAEGEREGGGMDRIVEKVEREVEAKKPGYGLNILNKEEVGREDGDVVMDGSREAEEQNGANIHQNGEAKEEAEQPSRTADEEAMDALLGNTKRSTLVLPAMSEEEAFERDYKDAPDMASLADYDRVPVEEFGAAMLRGMGWKDGEGIGANRGKKAEQTKVPTRRPALLGIGAKEEAAVAQEMGTWGKAAKGREVKIYNPVLLRDKRTGEMFTEEEAEQRKAREERERFELEFEEKEARRREKEKRRGDDEDRRDRRRRETSEERRERKDKERRRERDDSDEEYRRRKKEKERRRRDYEDGRDDERRRDDRHRERRRDHERRH